MWRFQRIGSAAAVAATCSHGRGLTLLGSWRYNSRSAIHKDEQDVASGENVLPGVDLATRVASPNATFPATMGTDEPFAPEDPRIAWKEHYSLSEEKPYYHNINTNETTFSIPDGFVTRFPQLYRRNGFVVKENGAVQNKRGADKEHASLKSIIAEAEAEAAAAPPGEVKYLTVKQKLAAYGGGGLLWYLIVHTTCCVAIFSLLFFMKVDLVAIARSYGFNIKVKPSEQVEEIAEHRTKRPPFFKTFVLAIILNKCLVPLQLLFTVATAPFLVHHLEPLARVLLPQAKVIFNAIKAKIVPPKA